MIRFRLAALVVAAATLCGCPPDEQAVPIVGVETSRMSDGRSRLSVTMTNGGDDDFDGDICFRITWLKDAVFELDGKALVRKSGEVVSTMRTCHASEIDSHDDLRIRIDSTSPIVGANFVVVVVEPFRIGSELANAGEERVVSVD